VAAGERAVLLFTVQRTDCERFAAASDIDPEFATGLRDASAAGVEVLAYACEMGTSEIKLANRIDASLSFRP